MKKDCCNKTYHFLEFDGEISEKLDEYYCAMTLKKMWSFQSNLSELKCDFCAKTISIFFKNLENIEMFMENLLEELIKSETEILRP